MSVPAETILWRRLDVPGHDACRLERMGASWRVDGSAVFLENGAVVRLDYSAHCDANFVSRGGVVRGWIGPRRVEYAMTRDASGAWRFNGASALAAGDSPDLDFGFTPATNLFAVRRLALSVGSSGESPAAWLDYEKGALGFLAQNYRRLEDGNDKDAAGARRYAYEAHTAGYEDVLEIAENGFVLRYPGLWETEQR